MPPRTIADAEGRAALQAVTDGATDRASIATAVRWTLQRLAEDVPGNSVEVLVPPYAAVQAVPGPRHGALLRLQHVGPAMRRDGDGRHGIGKRHGDSVVCRQQDGAGSAFRGQRGPRRREARLEFGRGFRGLEVEPAQAAADLQTLLTELERRDLVRRREG